VLPNSRVLIHQPSMGGVQGQVSDLEIQSAEIQRIRRQLEDTLARHTGKDVAEIRRDVERDRVLTADEAVAYGIADHVLPYRKLR
jgi:ATP-dependent Clp protease protease subunit